MTIAFSTIARRDASPLTLSSRLARSLFVLVIVAAAVCGFAAAGAETSAQAVSVAGADLTRLLRAMAALKALLAAGAAAAILWRLGSMVYPLRFAAYGAAGAAMAAGPGLIWGMAHVGLGALLLHGGLLAAVLLLWRDPAVEARLAVLVAARRMKLRGPASG